MHSQNSYKMHMADCINESNSACLGFMPQRMWHGLFVVVVESLSRKPWTKALYLSL